MSSRNLPLSHPLSSHRVCFSNLVPPMFVSSASSLHSLQPAGRLRFASVFIAVDLGPLQIQQAPRELFKSIAEASDSPSGSTLPAGEDVFSGEVIIAVRSAASQTIRIDMLSGVYTLFSFHPLLLCIFYAFANATQAPFVLVQFAIFLSWICKWKDPVLAAPGPN